MSVAIQFSDGGTLRAFDKRMALLATFEMKDLLNAVGALAETQTRRRIQEEKRSPQGESWPSLKESTRKRYVRLGKPTNRQALLQFEGELLDSIQAQVSGDDVFVGSNKEYARIHQMGGGGIEPREYLGISDENQLELEQLVADFIQI